MRSLREMLLATPPLERDAWVNRQLGIEELPDDGAELPRDGVPYLPASVDSILRFVELGKLSASDVIVDVGSGIGRAAWILRVLTGARVIGIEIQSPLSRLAGEGWGEGLTLITADASTTHPPDATAYFLYCPFSGATLDRWLDSLPRRGLIIGCVDFSLPERPWLTRDRVDRDLEIYRTR